MLKVYKLSARELRSALYNAAGDQQLRLCEIRNSQIRRRFGEVDHL